MRTILVNAHHTTAYPGGVATSSTLNNTMNGVWFFVALLSLTACRIAETKGNQQLSIAVFMSGVFTNRSEVIGGETYLTGLRLALELLNNDSRLLPGYSINASISDPQVSSRTIVLCVNTNDNGQAYFCVLFSLHLSLSLALNIVS